MAVIMPTGSYVLLRRLERPEAEDEHGVPVPSIAGLSVVSEAAPGAVREVGDGSWSYRLSVALWPVYVDDIIRGLDGSRFVIRTVKKNENVAASALDYVGGVCVPDPNPLR